jgi:hypothetical protein
MTHNQPKLNYEKAKKKLSLFRPKKIGGMFWFFLLKISLLLAITCFSFGLQKSPKFTTSKNLPSKKPKKKTLK